MLIKQLEDIEPFIKNDRLSLWEIFHPKNDAVKDCPSVSLSEIKDYTNPRKSKSAEYCIILEGEGKLYGDTRSIDVKPYMAIYIAPGERYRLENRNSGKPLRCIHITYPAWKPELEEEIKL